MSLGRFSPLRVIPLEARDENPPVVDHDRAHRRAGDRFLAAAQSQNGYSIDWWTVDGGGGTSAGAGYSLSGTIGQPDAGAMSGGGYTLTGGYWGAAVASSFNVYLPLAVRGGN